MTDAPIRTLIVDDEELSRRRLRSLLEEESDVEIVGECTGGRQAVPRIVEERPDLVILDVQMPDLDGFGVLAEVGPGRMPIVVFASAYAEFAVRAFEAYALDYLLKPFDRDRLRTALDRAREQLRQRQGGLDPRLAALLEHLRAPARPKYPEMLAIKTGDQYPLVRMEEIDWMEADGNYTRIHMGGQSRLVGKSIGELEEKLLDPDRFLRIHRSTIVNLSRVVGLEPLFQRELSVILRDGTRLTCSRRYRPNLQERVYFTS